MYTVCVNCVIKDSILVTFYTILILILLTDMQAPLVEYSSIKYIFSFKYLHLVYICLKT